MGDSVSGPVVGVMWTAASGLIPRRPLPLERPSRVMRMPLLFSYGTLRDPAVQQALFGREVSATPDQLPGFRIEYVEITDPEVIATSGSDRHPILRPGNPGDVVDGVCLEVDEEQLAAADRYEVDDYVRVSVPAVSGRSAWVYVAAADLAG